MKEAIKKKYHLKNARLWSAYFLSVCVGLLPLSVSAQGYRNDNPNLKHFYRAPQEIQILDNRPLVNDLRTNPGSTKSVGAPSAPQPLPKAGFDTYIYINDSVGGKMRGALPQTANGVPVRVPTSPSRTGLKANAGKLKIKNPPNTRSSTVVKGYKPYKTFPSTPAPANTASNQQPGTTTTVRGNVLHWNKRRPNY